MAQLERRVITAKQAARTLEEFWIGGLRRAAIESDVKRGSVMAGQSVGLVNEILPISRLLEQLIDQAMIEAERILKSLD